MLGIEGRYAKSHIIPRSLTEPTIKGERFIEAGRGTRPIRRFSSWYDMQLVITEGEKILADIDTSGIEELRKHKLIWSGWKGKRKLKFADYDVYPDLETGIGFRKLEGINSDKLRLFFLSILWRSLTTSIKEFSYLPNEGVDLERLREMIVSKDAGHYNYLPVMLDQISTLGLTHNYSPTLQERVVEGANGSTTVKFYRLYMQGIVAQIYICQNEEFLKSLSPMILGGEDSLVLIARKFEKSWQYEAAKTEIHGFLNAGQ